MGACCVALVVHNTEVKWKASQLWNDFRTQQVSSDNGHRRPEMVAIEACLNTGHVVTAQSRFAYVAMLNDSFDEYGMAAAKLGASLRQHNTQLDMVLLEQQNKPIPAHVGALLGMWKRCIVPSVDHSYSKLNAWRLTEYDAILLMDLDILALRNPADVFAPQHWGQMLLAGAQLGAVVVGCRGDTNNDNAFNTGVLLVQPKVATYELLRQGIQAVPHRRGQFASLINEYFKDQPVHPLPIYFNNALRSARPQTCTNNNNQSTWWYHRAEIRLLHFTSSKPWTYSIRKYWSKPAELLSCWWWGMEEYCAMWDMVMS
jgi:hypothetical protein